MKRWEEVLRTVGQRSLFDQKVAAGVRALGTSVGYISVDKVGRVALPEQLCRAAGITDDAEIFGLIDRFEIWNPDRYAGVETEFKLQAAEFFKEIGNETWNAFRAQPEPVRGAGTPGVPTPPRDPDALSAASQPAG
jgi:DNA-binding transcriptional regulator/RsmH inhibitor MraZ